MHVREGRRAAIPVMFLGLLAWAGCKDNRPKPSNKEEGPPVKTGTKDGGANHSHARGKMLIVDAGKHHALLTAHLSSKEGNELDVFFETTDEKSPQPVAIPAESLIGYARVGDGEPKKLEFTCAPAGERPKGERPGTCSHFVAKAPWMRPTDKLTVMVRAPMAEGTYRIEWKDFDPKKYAHHED